MQRKLFRTGNSIVLSLPNDVLQDLGLKVGDRVNLELDRERRRLILMPVKKTGVAAGVDVEFARQLSEFIELYRPALVELVSRRTFLSGGSGC